MDFQRHDAAAEQNPLPSDSVLTDAVNLRFNNVDCDLMYGGRITSEERSAISTYVGVGIAIVLIAGGVYVFFLAQKEKKETTGFDPNRPVPSDAVLKRRLKAEEYFVVREGGTQTPFQNDFWNYDRTGIYVDVIPVNHSSLHSTNSTVRSACPHLANRSRKIFWSKSRTLRTI